MKKLFLIFLLLPFVAMSQIELYRSNSPSKIDSALQKLHGNYGSFKIEPIEYTLSNGDIFIAGYKLVGTPIKQNRFTREFEYANKAFDKYCQQLPGDELTKPEVEWLNEGKKELNQITYIGSGVFDRQYKIHIKDEHEVQCIYKTDTIFLYFENAYRLSDEWCVYIKNKLSPSGTR